MLNSYQFSRYIISGIIAASANLLVYGLLLYRVHVWYTTAAAISFCIGVAVSFSLHKYWTFKQRSLEKIHFEIILFLVIAAANGFINIFLLFLGVQELRLGTFIANVLSNGMVALWSYFIYKHVTFIKREKA